MTSINRSRWVVQTLYSDIVASPRRVSGLLWDSSETPSYLMTKLAEETM